MSDRDDKRAAAAEEARARQEAAREEARRALLEGANKPAPTPGEREAAQSAPVPAPTAPPVQEPPEPRAAPADDSAPIEPPASAPAPRKHAAPKHKKGPSFDHFSEKELAHFSTRFSEREDERMNHVIENFPGRWSKQKIVKAALKQYLDQLFAEHSKP